MAITQEQIDGARNNARWAADEAATLLRQNRIEAATIKATLAHTYALLATSFQTQFERENKP